LSFFNLCMFFGAIPNSLPPCFAENYLSSAHTEEQETAMTESDERIERAILKIFNEPETAATLPPAPETVPDSTAAAIAQCRDAWQKNFDAYMQKNARKDGILAPGRAAQAAAAAYRGAMPPLVSHVGIRDFIACTAYGILMDAIPPERAGQLLYAAQVAVTSMQRAANPGKPGAHTPPPPRSHR
jgi:hypothetical protein